jgi:flagellar motor switch protein FliN/FliY
MKLDDLSLVLDVPVQIAVELGRTSLPIGDVCQLGAGSVVELGKAAGDALDLLVNGKLVARGEAVVVGEKYGIRITEVISPSAGVGLIQTATAGTPAANGGAQASGGASHVA